MKLKTQSMLVKYAIVLTLCWSWLIVFSPASYAQSTYGSVTGTITDASGGAIADVKVTLTNLETAQKLTQVTTSDGL